MSSSNEVCVDASLVAKLVVTEPGSDRAIALFNEWVDDKKQLIAPNFFEVEVDSILRQKVIVRKELTIEQSNSAFAELRALPIKQVSMQKQRQRAWEISVDFGFATVYDATYLALAELRRCEFWTADERLFNRVKGKLSFVRWLENYVPKITF